MKITIKELKHVIREAIKPGDTEPLRKRGSRRASSEEFENPGTLPKVGETKPLKARQVKCDLCGRNFPRHKRSKQYVGNVCPFCEQQFATYGTH